jgi:putative hydrolase of the HAD superfamily
MMSDVVIEYEKEHMSQNQVASMAYRNIVFDLGNVIVKLDEQATIKGFEQLGLKEVGHLRDNPELLKLFRDLGIGLITNQEFFDGVRRMANIAATDEQLTNAANAMLRYIPDEKKQKLLDLRRAGHRVYLLSNTNDIHWRYCADVLFPMQGYGVNDYFDGIFLSQELHVEKPSDEIFQTVIQETGIDPNETLFVDDLEENCQAAERNGYHTFHNKEFNDWLEIL